MKYVLRKTALMLDDASIERIMRENTHGVLALCDSDGMPYAVPVNYCYKNGAVYFHSAKAGHKLEALAANPKCSFCVVGKERIVAEEYNAVFESAIVFGQARAIADDSPEKREALELIARKYGPDDDASTQGVLERNLHKVTMIKLEIEYWSGKRSRIQ